MFIPIHGGPGLRPKGGKIRMGRIPALCLHTNTESYYVSLRDKELQLLLVAAPAARRAGGRLIGITNRLIETS